jgi:hypothetical protein
MLLTRRLGFACDFTLPSDGKDCIDQFTETSQQQKCHTGILIASIYRLVYDMVSFHSSDPILSFSILLSHLGWRYFSVPEDCLLVLD